MLNIRSAIVLVGVGALLFLGAGCNADSSTNEENLPKPPSQAELNRLTPDKRAAVSKLLEEQRKATEQGRQKAPRYVGP